VPDPDKPMMSHSCRYPVEPSILPSHSLIKNKPLCSSIKEAVIIAFRKTMSSNTYPVAMNDQKANKAFNVHGYPTKPLITPEGTYLQIPFNSSDWIKFIERYTED
jgi:hypothetical protein